jgi:hypothetical protein
VLTTTSKHITDGSSPADTTSNATGDFYVSLGGYVDSSGTCSGTSVNTGCHDSAGDQGSWARRWSTTAYNSNGTECGNCHGGFSNDWTFGTGTHNSTDGNVEHGYSWDGDGTSEVVGNHGGTGILGSCDTCHVFSYSNVYTTNGSGHIGWVGNGSNTSTYHGNGTLEMNSNSTMAYNSTSYGCNTQSCHDIGTSAVGHRLEKSRFPVGFLSGPQGSCSGCHGNAGSGNWWPDQAASPDRNGQHDLHISRIAAKLGYNLGSLTAAHQQKMCAYCHPDSGTQSAAFGGGHKNGTGTVNGYVDGLWHTVGAANSQDTNGTYTTGAADNCANVDCHNNKTTTAGYGWYGTSTSVCTMCHTAGGFAGQVSNPTAGLHSSSPAPKVTGVAHDEAFGASGVCTTCHTVPVLTTTSKHITDGSSPADTTSNATGDFYVSLGGYVDSSGTCSGSSVNTGCHDSYGDLGNWARRWSTTAYNANGTECGNCHGGFSNDWTFGTGTHDSTDGNVEHGYSWDGDGTSEVAGNHSGTGQLDACDQCHVYAFSGSYNTNATGHIGWVGNGSNTSTYHGNGSIEMNSHSQVRYNSTTYGCTTACHDAGTTAVSHRLEKSRFGLNFLTNAPGATCTGCHSGTGTGAKKVGQANTHTRRGMSGTYTAFNACTDCHPGNTRGATHAKNGDANVVAIPNYSSVGISYGHTVDTGTVGFVLGGDATTGTAEALICWNCHTNATYQGSSTISEWGVNNNPLTGSMVYNYGSLNQANWVGATWSPANTTLFGYKVGAIRSTHAANPASGQAALSGSVYAYSESADQVQNIRCAYCHDVHNLDVVDTVASGSPYLRGTWKGNPYKEDGAPHSTITYAAGGGSLYGAVPRGGTAYSAMGGYWIDQNSNSPAGSWTYSSMGGVCILCHGSNVNSLDYVTGENIWINSAFNGHRNSVVGGTATGAPNILDYSHGRPPASGLLRAVVPAMGMKHVASTSTAVSAYRGSTTKYDPNTTGRYAHASYNWGMVQSAATTTANYHKFSCSKCHNPHASRLPKLLITNCLDVKHNNWDTNKSTQSYHTSAALTDRNKQMAYFNSAQNCHRMDDYQTTKSEPYRPGWNKVSPW